MYDLPPDVRAVLSKMLDGVSRNDLAARATLISDAYRAGKPSSAVIASSADALAYALVRMPATYAAVRAALAMAVPHLPTLEPRSLVDLGAGPGTAMLAALAEWPTLETITAVEPNRALAALATQFADANGVPAKHIAQDITQRPGAPASLVLASYVQVELSDDQRKRLVSHALDLAEDAVLFVEPGTPAGFACIRQARAAIIAAGWHIAAPCPHSQDCPLVAPDWCHFSVRLPRRRDHMLVKGAYVPFEDEPYSFVMATRLPTERVAARVLRAPSVTKGHADLQLCAKDGRAAQHRVDRSDRAYKAARKASAGDTWE